MRVPIDRRHAEHGWAFSAVLLLVSLPGYA
jgi:hypothetical protein